MAIVDLSDLKNVLVSVAERLDRFRSVYERNETAVREQIVLPVLRGLGWDTENPDEVCPEDRSASGSPDYTLKRGSRSVVTIEVKKLDVDVAQPGALEQAHRYASASGIELCMATNGAVWVLARSFEAGRDLRGRVIWQVLLSENTLDDVAQKVVLVARSNIDNIDSFVRLQDLLDEKWEELLGDPADLVTAIADLMRRDLDDSAYKLPYPRFIEDYVDQRVREILASDTHAEPPKEHEPGTREADSAARRGSVAEILLEAGEHAIRERRLLPDSRIETGHARYLVSPQPTHKNNRPFFSPRRLSNGLYIETHCSMSTARRHAKLLDDYHHSSTSGRIRQG